LFGMRVLCYKQLVGWIRRAISPLLDIPNGWCAS